MRIEDAPGEGRGRGGVLDVFGAWPAPPHVGEGGGPVAFVDEAEPGETALARDEDRLAERGRMEAEAHDEAGAAGLVVARRHGLVGDEQIVQAPGARQTDLVGGVEHAGGVGEQRLGAVERKRLQERLRRQAAPTPEQVVHMRRRQPDMRGDVVERGLLPPALRDEGDDAAHALVIRDRDVGVGRCLRRRGDGVQGVKHEPILDLRSL